MDIAEIYAARRAQHGRSLFAYCLGYCDEVSISEGRLTREEEGLERSQGGWNICQYWESYLACLSFLSTEMYWVYIENTTAFLRTQPPSPGQEECSNGFFGRQEIPPGMVPHQRNSGPLLPTFSYPLHFAC